jgi:pumilio RNA-binding family
MRPNFLRLARHKYASNVCEKALLAANTDDKQLIIDELLKEGDKGFPMIGLLMRDQYGNYVVQTAMDVVGGEQRERLMHTIYAVAQRLLRSRAASGKNLAAREFCIFRFCTSLKGLTSGREAHSRKATG